MAPHRRHVQQDVLVLALGALEQSGVPFLPGHGWGFGTGGAGDSDDQDQGEQAARHAVVTWPKGSRMATLSIT
jgi:hypothetical protein